jgi:hypothetical protein
MLTITFVSINIVGFATGSKNLLHMTIKMLMKEVSMNLQEFIACK